MGHWNLSTLTTHYWGHDWLKPVHHDYSLLRSWLTEACLPWLLTTEVRFDWSLSSLTTYYWGHDWLKSVHLDYSLLRSWLTETCSQGGGVSHIVFCNAKGGIISKYSQTAPPSSSDEVDWKGKPLPKSMTSKISAPYWPLVNIWICSMYCFLLGCELEYMVPSSVLEQNTWQEM